MDAKESCMNKFLAVIAKNDRELVVEADTIEEAVEAVASILQPGEYLADINPDDSNGE